MGEVVHADFGGAVHDPILTKKQLARHPEIKRSTRWVELRVGEGMPASWDGHKRVFRLSEVRAWLAARP